MSNGHIPTPESWEIRLAFYRTQCSFLSSFVRCPFIHDFFSRAVSRSMDAAMSCLVWMSSAVLYCAVSRFLARLVERKCYSAEEEDSLRPLFEEIVYFRSWVRRSVNTSSKLLETMHHLRILHNPLIHKKNCRHSSTQKKKKKIYFQENVPLLYCLSARQGHIFLNDTSCNMLNVRLLLNL